MLTQSAARSYRQNSVMTSDPLKLILMVYDRAISGCHQRDLHITGRAITELMNGLDMEVAPLAGQLLAIYEYCGGLAREGWYPEAEAILQELRDTWNAVSGKANVAAAG